MDNCCDEVEACVNEEIGGQPSTECADSWQCLATECTDPATYEDCKAACDEGNFNENYNELVLCLENECYDDC